MILGVYWIVMAIFSVFVVPLLRQRGFDNNQIGIAACNPFLCMYWDSAHGSIFFRPLCKGDTLKVYDFRNYRNQPDIYYGVILS